MSLAFWRHFKLAIPYGMEERKAAFNHEGVFKDCEDFKDRQKDAL